MAPSSGNLLNQGSAYMLQAHWQETAGTGYVTTLYTMKPLVMLQNSSLPKQTSIQLYEGLRPGSQYALEICTIAGPHISLPLHLSNWTCECQKSNIVLLWREVPRWGTENAHTKKPTSHQGCKKMQFILYPFLLQSFCAL